MPWTAHIDGGSRGNPGPAAAGVVIRDDTDKTVVAAGFYLGRATNNQAEYQGLLHALKLLERAGARPIQIVSDSELMVRQINGQYKVRSPDLRLLYEEAMSLLSGMQWQMRHTLREGNTDADGLANEAMDAAADVVRLDTRGLIDPVSHDARPVSKTPAVQATLSIPPAKDICPAAQQKGQSFRFTAATPPGLCIHLCAAAMPAVLQLLKKAEPSSQTVSCSKTGCGAVLELKTE